MFGNCCKLLQLDSFFIFIFPQSNQVLSFDAELFQLAQSFNH